MGLGALELEGLGLWVRGLGFRVRNSGVASLISVTVAVAVVGAVVFCNSNCSSFSPSLLVSCWFGRSIIGASRKDKRFCDNTVRLTVD